MKGRRSGLTSLVVAALVGTASVALAPATARADNRPFPQHVVYGHGFVPHGITADDAMSSYRNWKSKYLKADCGGGLDRVEFGSPNGSTVSEGLGYGMILTAYFGDREAFDGLWRFALKFKNKNGLTGWKETCRAFAQDEGGDGSATDGDTDIGLGLVAAADQWGEPYKRTAIAYLATLKNVDFTTCTPSGRNLPMPGDWGSCEASNTSYFMPGFYRVFQEVTGDAFWGKAADDAVALWLVNRNPRTGLIANEVDQDGHTHERAEVDYNGCRIPWRAAVDYLWYGTPGSKDVTDRLTDWAGSFGIAKLVDGYNTNGTPTQSGKYTQLNAWVGSWACGAMSKGQDVVDNFAADFKAIADDNGAYYGSSLRTLYLLVLGGFFWRPGAPLAPLPAASAASVDPATPAAPAASPPAVPTVSPRIGTGTSSSCSCQHIPGHGDTTALAAVAALGALLTRRARRGCAWNPSR